MDRRTFLGAASAAVVSKVIHAPALVGWVAFASLAPGLAVSPLAGALLDRIGAVSAIAVDMIASAVLLFLFVAASFTGAMPAPLMLFLVALFSLTSPLSAAQWTQLMQRVAVLPIPTVATKPSSAAIPDPKKHG